MSVFVHVQTKPGVTAAQLEEAWTSAAEAVERGPGNLFVLMVDMFNQAGEPDQKLVPCLAHIVESLKSTFGTNEVAELARWEFELFWQQTLINVTLRRQGLVLTTTDGILAAASWPASLTPALIRESVMQAAETLVVARGLHAPPDS